MKRGQRPTIFLVKNRRGQLEISFGMIFSIILIIVFLAFAFYAITKFIQMQQDVQIQKFSQDFQDDVDNMWKSMEGSQSLTYSLPTKVISVCFVDDEFQNMEFTSNEIISGKKITNLDIAKITSVENPYCIPNVKGKVTLVLVKDYGETLVRVTR